MSLKQQVIHASSGHSKGPEGAAGGAVCDLSVIQLINCFN